MKKSKTILVLLSTSLLLFAAISSQVFAAGPNEPAQRSLIDEFHNPWPGVTMGGDFRFRIISADSITTLNADRANHNYLFNRYRTRLWTKITPESMPDMDINLRLVWEFRTWCQPPSKPQSTNFDEIIFDRFNVTLRNLWDGNLTAVLGRQDIILGKGWLVLEGNPLDGSRTIFFDALRFTYDWKDKNTKIDTILISNRANAADRLKPINDRRNALTEQNENGVILYLTNNSLENTQLEGYYIYKSDHALEHAFDNFPSAWSKSAKIHTIGGAIEHQFTDNWSARVEGAFQCGRKETVAGSGVQNEMKAWGTKDDLIYNFRDEKKNMVHFTYEFLSGDDPATKRNEAFDPLWGEWPQWSELYPYVYSRETMIGESTNLHRFNVGHSFKPCEKLEVKTDYHILLADQNTRGGQRLSDQFGFSGHGKNRGQLFTCWLNYMLTKQLSGHFLIEYLAPGNYYQGDSRSGAYFFRFDVEYTF